MVKYQPETSCPKGHQHTPGLMSLSWVPCRCPTASGGGHHGILCLIDVDGRECKDFVVPECVDASKRKSWTPGRHVG
jgi:hypothetical protein